MIDASFPKASIIIPCKRIDKYTKECISKCKEIDYPDFEIIVLPDEDEHLNDKVKVISTGNVAPGLKRNIASKFASGEILAYIDSDAYPEKNWLKNSVNYLSKEVGAVGGPAPTAKEDSKFAQVTGIVLSSFLVAGNLSKRYFSENYVKEVDEIPSVNFISRKNVIEAVGGWNEKYWPGEDTLLCHSIRKLGFKLLFASDVVVYHHRRSSLLAFLKQIYNYGLHRGFFVKKFTASSFKITYFIPTLFVLWLTLGIIFSVFIENFFWLYISTIVLYLAADTSIALKNIKYANIVFFLIPLTHIVYGISFLKGLIIKDLAR